MRWRVTKWRYWELWGLCTLLIPLARARRTLVLRLAAEAMRRPVSQARLRAFPRHSVRLFHSLDQLPAPEKWEAAASLEPRRGEPPPLQHLAEQHQ